MNIRIVRNKIRSVTNVRKITQAMQLVSAIKMKKAQQVATEGKPYQEFLEKSIKRFTKKVDVELSELLKVKEKGKTLNILITTNKGLCGAFNVNLLRFIVQKKGDIKGQEFITIGRKGAVIVKQLGGTVLADFSEGHPQDSISAVFNLALEKFLNENYSTVNLYYNKFVSSLRYDPTEDQLLPVKYEEEKTEEAGPDYTIEPSPEQIVDTLLKNYVEEKIRFSLNESEAGEHSARMIAMKNATDNANDVIYNLTLLRNKLRQQKITYELLDMVTATVSVEN